MIYIKDNGFDDYEGLIDFANMVFSMEYTGIDFVSYLPKAYLQEYARDGITTHHMFKDDNGKIRALIDTYPIRLRLDDTVLNAEYVGTVAVHPRFRNMGLFSKLMENVYSDARAKGTDLLIVDGDRRRYGNFGYEKAGMRYSFDIDYKSALACVRDTTPYSFEEVDALSPYIDKMYGLYSRRNVTARGRDDFYISLIGMKARVYAVLKNGNVVGYVNLSEDELTLCEFEIDNEDDIPKLMLDLMDGFDMPRLCVVTGSDEVEKIKRLEIVSSYYNVSQSHQIKILNYENTLGFLLGWKRKYSKLSCGEYTFGITKDGAQTNYRIAVGDLGLNVSVFKTDGVADGVFDEREFVKIMTTGYYHMDLVYNDERIIKAPTGWFPLPFFLPVADTF